MSGERSKHAVVLSGGGADGAYAVGVLKALTSGKSPTTGYRPLQPDVFVGTSIGSFNASFVVSQWDQYGPGAVTHLESLWLNRLAEGRGSCHNGAYRFRANPLEMFNPACYVGNPFHPWIELLSDGAQIGLEGLKRLIHMAQASDQTFEQRLLTLATIMPFVTSEPMRELLNEVIDYSGIRHSSRELQVVAVEWATGIVQIFKNRSMTDQSGPSVIAASAALPGFFPAVKIGTREFVDGSVLMNTPLKPAIQAGADVLHVIYLDPAIQSIPLSEIENFPETFYRMQQIGWAKAFNDDIRRAARTNDRLTAYETLKSKNEGLRDSEDLELLFGLRDRVSSRPFRPLTIFRYHPRESLSDGLGLLNFERDRLADLIQRGFDDTIYHDSAESEDILPDGSPTVEPILDRPVETSQRNIENGASTPGS